MTQRQCLVLSAGSAPPQRWVTPPSSVSRCDWLTEPALPAEGESPDVPPSLPAGGGTVVWGRPGGDGRRGGVGRVFLGCLSGTERRESVSLPPGELIAHRAAVTVVRRFSAPRGLTRPASGSPVPPLVSARGREHLQFLWFVWTCLWLMKGMLLRFHTRHLYEAIKCAYGTHQRCIVGLPGTPHEINMNC